MKESCVECRHHDVFWGGAGCNLLNNGERCKFEPLQEPAEGRRMTKKAVLISIRPKWCEMIANGKKTVEVRKTRPTLEPPFKCYVYCTQPKRPYDDFISFVTEEGSVGFFGGGKVIGEFVCDAIFPILVEYSDPESRLALREFPFTCLTDKQIMDYLGNGKEGCAWHISDLEVYDTPKELSEFPLKRPPQSWCYVKELEGDDHAQK